MRFENKFINTKFRTSYTLVVFRVILLSFIFTKKSIRFVKIFEFCFLTDLHILGNKNHKNMFLICLSVCYSMNLYVTKKIDTFYLKKLINKTLDSLVFAAYHSTGGYHSTGYEGDFVYSCYMDIVYLLG